MEEIQEEDFDDFSFSSPNKGLSRDAMLHEIKLGLEFAGIPFKFNRSKTAEYTFIIDKGGQKIHVAVGLEYGTQNIYNADYEFYIAKADIFDAFYRITSKKQTASAIVMPGRRNFHVATGKSIKTCTVREFLKDIGADLNVSKENFHCDYENYAKKIIEQDILREIWGANSPKKVFITYPSQQSEFALNMKQELETITGYSYFMAEENIQQGKKWRDDLENALFSADMLLVTLFDNSSSPWIEQEIGIAYGRKIPIMTILFGNSVPNGFLEQFQSERIDRNNVNWRAIAGRIRNFVNK